MSSKRANVLAEQIRQILSTALIYEMRDGDLEGVVITEVNVSADLGYADIKIQAPDTPEHDQSGKRALAALKRATGAFKRMINGQIRLRKIPHLRFHIDEGFKAERRIQELLDGLDIPPEEPAE